MGKKVIGIDIGVDYVHIVEGTFKDKVLEVYNAFLVKTPQNAYMDGRITDFEALAKALATGLSEKKLSAKSAAITIQGSSVVTRDLVLACDNADQLESIVQFNMAEYLTGNIDSYLVEYTVTGELIENGSKKYKVRAAAMPKDIVMTYLELLTRLRLKPEALDIHSNAFSKLIDKNMSINSTAVPEKANVFIDIGYRSTTVNITALGSLELSRSFGTGVRDFIFAAQGDGKNKVESDIFKEINLESTVDDSVLRPLINQWTGELQRICQYYTTRMQGMGISAVYLYGGGAELTGIGTVIRSALNVNTKKIESISSMKFISKAEKVPVIYFLNASGSLITGKRGQI